MNSKKNKITLNLMLSFIVFSMLLNSVSVIILQLSQNHKYSYTGLGLLEFFKDIPIALVSIFMVDYIKKRSYYSSLYISLIICAICSFTIPFMNEFWFLKIWFVLIGISFSIGKICVFSIIKNISDSEKEFSKIMSRTEAAFMLGVFIVNIEFALILNSDYKDYWKFGFWLVGFISSWAAFQFYLLDEQKLLPINDSKEKEKIDFSILFDYKSLLFFAIVIMIVFTEQIFNSWLPTFYKNTLKANSFFALQSSAFLALFSFIGRLLASKFVVKFAPLKIFFFCLISGILLTFSAYVIGQDTNIKIKILMILFPIVGVFIAPLYPMLNSKFLSKFSEKKVGKIVSIIILFTSLGGSIGSMSTAYIFQKNLGNYYLLFATIPLILILIFSIFYSIKEKLSEYIK
ncbi:MFS transporter [Cloacibacterium rupense]|nr:MFS transporter [Cloacibacterium rupense]